MNRITNATVATIRTTVTTTFGWIGDHMTNLWDLRTEALRIRSSYRAEIVTLVIAVAALLSIQAPLDMVIAAALQTAEEALVFQQQLVQDIRAYAIARHQDGDFCREGLDQALDHFGLDRYQPRPVVAVTINATVALDADNEASATERVQYLIDGVAYSGQSDDDRLDVQLDSIEVEPGTN